MLESITLEIEADPTCVKKLTEFEFSEFDGPEIRGAASCDVEKVMKQCVSSAQLIGTSAPTVAAYAVEHAVIELKDGVESDSTSRFTVTMEIDTSEPGKLSEDESEEEFIEQLQSNSERLKEFLVKAISSCQVTDTNAPDPVAYGVEYAVNKPRWEKNRKQLLEKTEDSDYAELDEI